MLLYLVQHAEAVHEDEDPSRPLSDKGKKDIAKVASHMSKQDMVINQILHSSKLRAKQTADILSEHLGPSRVKALSETDGLLPQDDPGIWSGRLLYMTDNVILVGHLPHLGRLASLLTCGDPEKNIVSFSMAGTACLERDENGVWSMMWMITPDIL